MAAASAARCAGVARVWLHFSEDYVDGEPSCQKGPLNIFSKGDEAGDEAR